MYIWEHNKWPTFTYDSNQLLSPLAQARRAQGVLLGDMRRIGFEHRQEAQLTAFTAEALTTSAIEGEYLDSLAVRSSLASRLHMDHNVAHAADAKTEGLLEMLLDAVSNYKNPLTTERLFRWHTAMFPTTNSLPSQRLIIGDWRNDGRGPMQVVSGRIDRPRVHYQAPPANRVPDEMNAFLGWFNSDVQKMDGLIRTGLAHLWFVTIHPFEDGNGRIARAIADLSLAMDENSSQRFYSMSAQISTERNAYYDALEKTQKGELDVTEWLVWFLGCFQRAVEGAESSLQNVLNCGTFWANHAAEAFNDRQRKVMNLMLKGFEGKLTTKKWSALTKTSIPTAQRDINDLLERGILKKGASGSKKTHYIFAEAESRLES